ncbi:MAG: hypothetical protein J6W43_08925 [Prevotella sp.]|nr:hypothetical protein [Prevotella sp.]
MKKKLLFSMLLLFVGVSMQAQSIATEQMDERFNDGTKFPFGWFGEGWKIDNGKAKAKATKDSGNNGFPGMGGGSMGNNPMSENPMSENPMGSMGGMNMFGGDRIRTYLLTPPVSVKDGEDMVFSARKSSGDDSGFGGGMGGFSFDLKAIMGFTDTLFVVERSVYGRNQWVRVADFTSTLNDEFQTLTVSGTPKGEYRFRFISYVDAEIDSVAGFHIDKEAPDLLVTVDSLHTRFVDYSVCAKDSIKEFIVINTGTGTLKVNISSNDPELFSIDKNKFSIAAGDSAKLNVTFHYSAGSIGKNEAMISFVPEDERILGTHITVAAVITDPEVWAVDFNDNKMPFGCFGEGFVVKEGIATHYNPAGGGMAAMGAIFGGGGASDWFMTPPLTIQGVNDAVVFSLKNGDGSYKGPIIDPQASVTIEKSVYGSNKWEKVDAYQFKDTLNHVKWISWFPAGDYRFRFVSGDSLCIDSIAGGRINMNAPDLLVRYNGRSVQTVNYGIARGNQTKTFQLINTGTSALQLYAMSSDPTFYTLSQQMFEIAAGESATVDVTFNHNPEALGAHQAALVLVPQNAQIAMQMIYLSAYITYKDAWSENFEQEFEVEEGETPDLPLGWETTGWLMTKGGGMDMMAMMGMGGGEKSWAPHTDSDAYELITPSLQARKGDVLRFYADINSGWLNVFYKRNDDADWTYHDTYITADSLYFIAPFSGVYQLKFTGSSVSVDDFIGFQKPMEWAALMDDSEYEAQNAEVIEHFKGKKVNVTYDRVLSAIQQNDGSWYPRAYVVSLPYDYDFTDYNEADQAWIFRLRFKEEYYKQFIFLPEDNANPNLMKAGRVYLVVVTRGQLNLNATGVTLSTEVVDDEQNVVNSFEDWYFEDKLTPVGKWQANFHSISDEEADNMNIYCLRDDGTWARFQSGGNAEQNRLSAYRGYFEANTSAAARTRAAALPGTYKTMFQMTNQQGGSSGESINYDNLDYEATIPYVDSESTDIQPTIRAIDADGTSRYFDIQGRLLNGKPVKGVYIENGKKVINQVINR